MARRNRNLAVWGGYEIVAQNYLLLYHKDFMPCKLYHGLKHLTFYPISSTRLDHKVPTSSFFPSQMLSKYFISLYVHDFFGFFSTIIGSAHHSTIYISYFISLHCKLYLQYIHTQKRCTLENTLKKSICPRKIIFLGVSMINWLITFWCVLGGTSNMRKVHWGKLQTNRDLDDPYLEGRAMKWRGGRMPVFFTILPKLGF